MAGFMTIKAPMWDQMQLFCKYVSDHQIRFVLHFNSILDERVFYDAVKITVENNPITCAKYTESKKTGLWKFSEKDIDKIYSFIKCQEPEKIIEESVLEQINTFTGPQVKISLIRSENDTLVINCDHSITDAAGVKEFVSELADNYTRISQNKTIAKPNYVPKRSLRVLSKKLSFKEKWSVIKLSLSNKRNAPTFQQKIDSSDIQHPAFITHTIGPDEFDKIKAFGKQYSATINDMILALYFYTLKKTSYNSNKTNRLSYSADLRVFMDASDYDTLSNYSAIHTIDIDNTNNNFVGLLKEITTITTIRKEMKYNLADFPMMALLFKMMSYHKLKSLFHKEFDKIKKGISNAPPGITNMGIIEESKIAFDSIIPYRAYLLGTVNHPNLFIMALSSYKKHLTLSVGSYFNELNNNFVSSFIEELKITISKEVL